MSRILLLDDDSQITKSLARAFGKAGFETDTFSKGPEALQALQSGSYDGIVSDVDMPAMHGKTFFKMVRKEFPELASRFIFHTGNSEPPSGAPTIEKGSKPKSLIDLMKSLIEA